MGLFGSSGVRGVVNVDFTPELAAMIGMAGGAKGKRCRDCGGMVTASHNPPEYGGLKLWNPDGSGFGVEQSKGIEKLVETKKFKLAKWDTVGAKHTLQDAVECHAMRFMSGVGKAKLRVVVDCAN